MKYSVLQFENEEVYDSWEFATEAETVACFFEEFSRLNKEFLDDFYDGCYKTYDQYAGFCRIIFKDQSDKIRSLAIIGCDNEQNQAIYEKIKN